MTRVIEIVRRGRPGADGASGVVQVLRSEESVTLSSANRGFAIVADDDIAVQLPPASGIGAAWSAWFLAEAGAITLTSTSNINGSASDLLIPQGYSAQVLTDGTEYLVQFGIAEPVLTVNTNSIGNESDVAGTTLTDALNQIDIDIDALTQNQSNALSGGTADQALFKVNSDPFNAEWRALPELTEPQATDPASTVLGLVSGQRIAQAIDARRPDPFVSAEITPAKGGNYTFAHGLGRLPHFVTAELRCAVAANGFAVNDVIDLATFYENSGGAGVTVFRNATNVRVLVSDYAPAITVITPTSRVQETLNLANFRLRVRAW